MGGAGGWCLETDLPTTKATEQAQQSPEPMGPPGGTRRHTAGAARPWGPDPAASVPDTLATDLPEASGD